VRKLIESAAANAEHNFKMEREGLFVKAALVNQGPSLKRWRPRAMGSAAPILKRTCHITVVLESRKPQAARPKAEAEKGAKVKPAARKAAAGHRSQVTSAN
jgi:large subunit ribosomal protein L22